MTLTATRSSKHLDARRGIVRLHPETLAALGLQPGDPVRLTSRHHTTAIALEADRFSGKRSLYADDLTLGNIGAREGSAVVAEATRVAAADSVVVRGPASIVAGVSPDTLRLSMLSKIVTQGDDVSLLPIELDSEYKEAVSAARRTLNNTLGMGWTSMVMTVAQCDPSEAAMITLDTQVSWENDAPHRVDIDLPTRGTSVSIERPTTPRPATSAPRNPTGPRTETTAQRPRAQAEPVEATSTVSAEAIAYEDLAGVRVQAEELRELLDLGFNHREVLSVVGTDMTLGMLVCGPSGTGKSSIARSVVAEVGAHLVEVPGDEVGAMAANDAAERLRRAVSQLQSPGVLLVTDADAIAKAEDATPLGTMFKKLVAETIADGHAVVCTVNNLDRLDGELRSHGRLEHEITVPMPDTEARRELLKYFTRGMKVSAELKLEAIAERSPGYVAADLLALVREAGVRAAMRAKDGGATALQESDFDIAFEAVRPSSMEGDSVELGGLTLDDVGGMEEVKQTLTETVMWPLMYPDAFTRLGIEAPRGVLLYGPPGCGKTYIVRAVAGSGNANVITIKGSELLNKWVGESEANVRDLFRRARQASPTLMFFDELDALAPVRGQGTDGGTADRVVAALLTELDGAEALRDVVVVGATNRPDMIDPALRRPGRLERLVYVPPPDAAARAEILAAAGKNVPFSDDVDLVELGDQLEFYSAADCAALVREAALTAMRESLDASTVTAAHLQAARNKVRPSLDAKQLEWLESFAQQRKQ
ncbi:AAA family ATPase [Natronoglycomyces albus]|uniref:AAA family ATPase n=1 Tax=Natronoglycomyces albus TaxID=2811108 RepID=A0A895XTW5_9ACTN|nr:AAA family ATPase [Natronoglycomyces albus]